MKDDGNPQRSLMMETRLCKKCGATKPLDEFSPTSHQTRRHECRTCNNARQLRWYYDRREQRQAIGRQYYAEIGKIHRLKPEIAARMKVTKKAFSERAREAAYALLGNQCNCCGERNHIFLTLDHIHRDGAHYRKNTPSHGGAHLHRRILKGDFQGVFQLLCFNCNLGRERNASGMCPHQERSTIIPKGSTAEASTSAAGSACHPYPAFAGILGDDDMICSQWKH